MPTQPHPPKDEAKFTAARWKDDQGRCNHAFRQLAKRLNIRLEFIKPRHPWTNVGHNNHPQWNYTLSPHAARNVG